MLVNQGRRGHCENLASVKTSKMSLELSLFFVASLHVLLSSLMLSWLFNKLLSAYGDRLHAPCLSRSSKEGHEWYRLIGIELLLKDMCGAWTRSTY